MLLADAAQALENKLYIMGGGWTITGPEPTPSAIALYLKIPWDEADRRHRLRLELLGADGDLVEIDLPDGRKTTLTIENEFEVGRPEGLKPGTPIELSLALSLGPLPLPPASRFEWRLHIDDETNDLWTLPFATRVSETESRKAS